VISSCEPLLFAGSARVKPRKSASMSESSVSGSARIAGRMPERRCCYCADSIRDLVSVYSAHTLRFAISIALTPQAEFVATNSSAPDRHHAAANDVPWGTIVRSVLRALLVVTGKRELQSVVASEREASYERTPTSLSMRVKRVGQAGGVNVDGAYCGSLET
jgi:hypothetical protein